MKFILEGAGVFIYPLGFCSFLALFIIIERLISLRDSKVIPREIANALIEGRLDSFKCDLSTTAGRIVHFFKTSRPDSEALKAFVQLEITRLERGMFWLDIVISAAPLLGLLGTVAGLVTVFASPENGGLPTPEAISRGVGLALSTTVIGLSIAIPAVVGNSYLIRRIEKLCARLNIGVERLIDLSDKR